MFLLALVIGLSPEFGLSLIFELSLLFRLSPMFGLGVDLLPSIQLGLNTGWTKIEGNKHWQ